jgi:drug/metabolite transporter (DMT)-like permease
VTIVLLALGAGATFGAMTVAVRVGLQRLPDAHGATFAVLASALLVVGVGALVRHDIAGSWRFFLAGLIAPGLSQLLFTRAVAEVGASRASAAVGSGPLYALALAFVFLGEPVRIGLVLGGLAIVAGGVLLAAERQRPAHLRARGLVYGLGCAVCFAVRDNLVRALHAHGNPETAATATILAGLLVAAVATRRLPSRQQFSVLAPAGVLFGLSYELLFEAYFHGRVSIVSPLVASETLWAFVLAAVFLRQSEDMGLRLVLGATAILAGGVVIGIAAVS